MDDFRKCADQLNEWIADYLQKSEKYPVLSRAQPGQIRGLLPSSPPEEPESFEQIFRDFKELLLPGVTHWNHPAFFAYFAITGSAPGVLAEMLSAALNINGMLWKTGPSSTELEEVTLDWLRQMLGLPEGWFGIMMDTASVGSLCALVAAREALDLQIRQKGMAGRPDVPRLRIYTSEQAHSSIEKAAIVLGIGKEGVHSIPVDEKFQMRPDALARAIEEDLNQGQRPFCVVATVGTTSTTSIDPVQEIAAICERHQLWLHIDAAYGGAAAILPERRAVLAGCERADTFLLNPHKWLFVPFDCTAFYTRKPDLLARAFSLVPEYLRTESEGIHNFMDYGIQLGRRFRALKLWMVLRMFGVKGLQQALRGHLELANRFAGWVKESPDFELMAPVPLSVVCFRAHPAGWTEPDLDRLNQSLMDAVNRTGEMYISHTKLNGKLTLRLAISHLKTEERHVSRAWELLRQHCAAERRL